MMTLPTIQPQLKPHWTAHVSVWVNVSFWAIIEPRSNTMRMGSHKEGLADSARLADAVIWYQPEGLDSDLQPVVAAARNHAVVANTLDEIIQKMVSQAGEGDAVVIMSNGGFGGLHQKLIQALQHTA